MDYTSLSTRAKLLIISGSLLIHLLLLFLLFIAITGENPFDSSRHIDELATILAQSRHEAEDATVIFYDEPSQQASASMGSEPISSQTDVPFDAYAKTEVKEDAANVVHDAARYGSSGSPRTDLASIENNTQTQQDDTTPVRPAEPAVARQAKAVRSCAPRLDERRRELDEGYERTTKITAAIQNKKLATKAEQTYRTVENKAPAPQEIKKPGKTGASGIGNITLAEITKGFLKSMAQESGGTPTSLNAEQLARQRYGTRVWSVLRQSYNAYKSPTQLLNDIHTHAVFVLTIDKEGKILSAELQHPKKSLDIIQIERSLLQAVYKAGLFPPIPKQFDVDTITFSYPLGIRGHQGTHMYDLIYE